MEQLFRNNFNEAADILKEFISDKKNWDKLEKADKNIGKMSDLCNVLINTPKAKFSERIQEIHIKVINSLVYFQTFYRSDLNPGEGH